MGHVAMARLGEDVVEVRLSVDGTESDGELERLAEWLRQEPELRGRVKPTDAKPIDGELGVLGEALVAAVGGGGAISVLITALQAFLTTRKRSDFTITVKGPGGKRTIIAKNVRDETAELLLRQALGVTE
jgi:Effector Associated Constant Component 1